MKNFWKSIKSFFSWIKRRNHIISAINELRDIQGNNGNWDYDAYMHGMYNGMELIISLVECREPDFNPTPEDGYITDRFKKPVSDILKEFQEAQASNEVN